MKTKKTSQEQTDVQNKSISKVRSPRKRDRSSTEERLIKAGTEVFSKYGFDAATTKMISKKSSVNESLIMRYFGGKEGLMIEIIRRFFESKHTTPLTYPPQETLEAELIHYSRYLFASMKENNSVMKMMLLRASIDPKMKKKVRTFINTEGNPLLIERIQLLQQKSKLPVGMDPQTVHLIAFQNLSTIFISEILFETEKQIEIEQKIENLTKLTIKGLFQGL